MDQLTSLAFSLHSNKGAYALLVGSGISRSAGIPTGWEVTLDMIRKVAAITGEDAGENPESWFKSKFGKDATYSELLDTLARAPSERATYLKSYFEPTEQEREDGKKSPTAAHRSIAKLVVSGHVKVIVTTNFDRLLERAIEDEGITPSVISSPDMCDGATPLIHSRCTIIKVNGDYLDMRIKNTVSELTSYDSRIDSLLDRVFDDFGLIVCGWSGDWDIGLRGAIERIKGRRYSTFWITKNNPTEASNSLVKFRSAAVITVADADSFFVGLEEKLSAIDDLSSHPMSSKLAVITLKKYLAEDKYKIRLHDLISDEVQRVCLALDEKFFSMNGALNSEILTERANKYSLILERLAPLVMNGVYWSKPEHDTLWVKTVERVANTVPDGGGLVMLRAFRLFPSLVLLYSAGISCVVQSNFKLLHRLLYEVKIKGMNNSGLAVTDLHTIAVLETNRSVSIKGKEDRKTPLSDHLFEQLKEQFKDLIPDERDFEEAFDRFEYFKNLAYLDKTETHPADNHDQSWAPPGRHSWKSARYDSHISKAIASEIEDKGKTWLPFQAGFFGGSVDRLNSVKKSLDNFNNKVSWR